MDPEFSASISPRDAKKLHATDAVGVRAADTRAMELLSSVLPGSAPAPKLDPPPPDMLDFTLLKTTGALAPRLGRLSLPRRKSILTPALIGNTSRGVIPHISQDTFAKSLDLNGVYVALEDCTAPAAHDVAPR